MPTHSTRRTRFVLAAAILFIASPLSAQRPRLTPQQQAMQKRAQEQMKQAAANQPVLPSDPQLLALHREFIVKAEKLAQEYERKKQLDQAREVYESLVRLVPKYGVAEAGLQRILISQAQQDFKLTKVMAADAWQDSGATLQKDMPVYIEVQGKWKVVYETGAEGIQIPNEMKPRNSKIQLGTLIGVIVSSPDDLKKPKSFVVTNGTKFTAEKTGRLYLRMFDVDPSDNEGQMFVRVQSTFAK